MCYEYSHTPCSVLLLRLRLRLRLLLLLLTWFAKQVCGTVLAVVQELKL